MVLGFLVDELNEKNKINIIKEEKRKKKNGGHVRGTLSQA
jgi:hypothetical protein